MSKDDIWRFLLQKFTIFNVRQSYCDVRLDVRPFVRHTLVLCPNGSTYRQTVFTAW